MKNIFGRPCIPLVVAPHTTLTASQQWLVTLCALLSVANNERLNTIASIEDYAQMRRGLYTQWGIHDRTSFLEIEESLSRLSSKTAYEAVWAEIRRMYPDYLCGSQAASVKSFKDGLRIFGFGVCHEIALRHKTKQAIRRLAAQEIEINGTPVQEKFQTSLTWFVGLAAANIDARQVNNLVAWDIARFIFLSRNACDLGWISEAEFFELCAPAARLAQQSYASWKDFLDAHFVAAMIWQYNEGRHWLLQDAHSSLLNTPSSPVLVLPWHLNLDFIDK